jgi:hypothetical protein
MLAKAPTPMNRIGRRMKKTRRRAVIRPVVKNTAVSATAAVGLWTGI